MFAYKLYFHILAVMKMFMFKVIYGSKIVFGKHVTFRRRFDLLIADKAKVKINKEVFFNNDCSINALEYIEIGEFTMFGEGVKIYDHNHKFRNSNLLIKDQGFSTSPVLIGSNCWIGSNVVILKGANIGDNSVIGAGCIIDFKVTEGSIIKGNRELLRD